MDITSKLDTAIFVLNNIEIKGKVNLLNLGGVIDLLEQVKTELESPAAAESSE